MKISSRFTLTALTLAVLSVPGFAGQFSFTGNFTNDNDVQQISFSLSSASTVTLQTWSYGGGINANGQVILAGGFEPILSLFDATTGGGLGSLIPGSNSSCPPNNADPNRLNFCFDVFGQPSLSAGDYILALTQSPNIPINNLGDGFVFDSDPNFNNGFVGTLGFQGDSHWAVDILNVDQAALVAPVPEPGSALLAATAVLLAAIGARKIRPRIAS